MGRFLDFLNTPLAVLVVLVVVVGVNAYLYLGQRTSEAPGTAPAERGGPRTTAVERTERSAGDGEATRPAPTTTTSTTATATTSATATASATASP
jgi:cytoskeletal protein RodZ